MKKRYIKIPPPGTRKQRRPKRRNVPKDLGDLIVMLYLVLLGMMIGWCWRGVTAKAASAPVTQTEQSVELKQIASEPVIAQSVVMERTEPEEPELISLGKFTITAYCPCEICCGKWSNPDNPTTASGAPAVEGVTVASDWQTLPKGTEIYIDGVGSRTVQDKPAKWIVDKYDGRIIDLYFESHEDAWNWGKQELEVWTYEAD